MQTNIVAFADFVISFLFYKNMIETKGFAIIQVLVQQMFEDMGGQLTVLMYFL